MNNKTSEPREHLYVEIRGQNVAISGYYHAAEGQDRRRDLAAVMRRLGIDYEEAVENLCG